MRTNLTVIVLATFALVSTHQLAQAFCFEPTRPYCIDAFGTFDNDWSFQSCKSEVESYLSSVDLYVQCVVDDAEREARKLMNEANQSASMKQIEADDVISTFNCKAKGNSFC